MVIRRAAIAVGLALVATACGGSNTNSTPTTPAPTSRDTSTATSGDDWPAYMGDAARSGVGPSTPQAGGGAHRTWTAQVDGDVYAEPLVANGEVIAATEHDTVYALDPATGAVRWRTHLGEPVPLSQLQCGDIDPNGITATPVVDTAAGTVDVVAMLENPVRHELYALRLGDGTVAWHRGVDGAGADPHVHQQRSALTLAGGRLDIAYGGFTGDCGAYTGLVVSLKSDGGGDLTTLRAVQARRAGIWAPPGPVVAADGSIWVATGNASPTAQSSGFYGGNQVLRLDSAAAHTLDAWAPQNWAQLNQSDTDLGSMSPALLPDGLVFATGKEGPGYLLRQAHLGGIGGEAFRGDTCPRGGAYGGAAVDGDTVYVPCVSGGLAALRIDANTPAFSVQWRAAGAPGGTAASTPIVAYGLVWTVAAQRGARWSGTLLGLDPATGAVRAGIPLGAVPHFPSPAAAGGSLFVAGLGTVYAVSVR